MQSSSANPVPDGTATPATQTAQTSDPAVPPWQQVWSGPAQRTVCALLAAAVLVLAIRGLLDWHAGNRQPIDNWSYRVDLNQARSAELQQVPGVGPQLARRIEEYQQMHGGFQQLDDLGKVPGVGPATLERMRPWVYVGKPTAPVSSPITSGPVAKAQKSKKAEAFTGPPLDVNVASTAQLQKVPGIGPKMSQRIIDERGKKPFQTVDELRRVPGIGPKTLEKLRPFVTVGGEKSSLVLSPFLETAGYNSAGNQPATAPRP